MSLSEIETTPIDASERIDELLHSLGDVPASRVRWRPFPTTAVEKDIEEVRAKSGRLCELVDGVLVEKPMGYFESDLACILIEVLRAFVRKYKIGFVLGESGMVRTVASQIRMPDVSFYRWERFPDRTRPAGPTLPFAPDLAVEILSPTNTVREMARKRWEYFESGSQLVWEVEPVLRVVHVYSSPTNFVAVDEHGTLEGGSVLPEFTLPVRDWFGELGWKDERS
jgi:Uma2 family endonuclease